MPRKMPRKSDKYLQQEGEHLARVLKLIDLGEQDGYMGQGKEYQVRVTFEIVDDIQTFTKKDGEEVTGPSLLDATYTQKLSKSAKFYKLCKAIIGRKVDDDDFDPSDIVGKYIMLDLEQKVSGQGNPYMRVTDYFRPSKDDIEELTPDNYDPDQNDHFAWWLEEGTDWDVFDNFPEWMQDLISSTPQYAELNAATETTGKPRGLKKTGLNLDEEDEAPPERKSRKKKAVESEDY